MTMELCYLCEKGSLQKKKVAFRLYGELVGMFPADVCSSCGEHFFNESTSKKIDESAKSKGLWGLEAETNVGQTGDSLMVRVNKQLASFLNLRKGARIKIRPEDRRHLILEI